MTEVHAGAGGGRGARERILRAAATLFYERGINSTGIEQLAAAAHVSKRTLYQHFDSKDELVRAYLQRIADKRLIAAEATLDRTDLPPRERLIAIFTPPFPAAPPVRGCPYVNASVEIADPGDPARELAASHKRAFIGRLADTAAQAGAPEPSALAHQLAVLYDGQAAQGTVLNSTEPMEHARAAASLLIELAIGPPAREAAPARS